VRLELDTARRRQLKLGPRPRPLGEAIDEHLEHREATVERSTRDSSRTALGHLRAWYGGSTQTDRVVPETLQKMADNLVRRGYAATTIDTYIRSIRVFFRWLGGHDPVAGIQLPNPGRTDVEIWSDDDLERIREAADHIDENARLPGWPSARLMVEVLLATGARQAELFALEWRQLDETARTVRISHQLYRDGVGRTKPLKGKLARTTLVLPPLWPYLEATDSDWRSRIGIILARGDGRAFGRRPQTLLVASILNAARLARPGVGYHAGRHAYARLFVEANGSLEQLQRSLGHTSIRTTERTYGHLSEDAAARLARERIYGA
jgi:integrase